MVRVLHGVVRHPRHLGLRTPVSGCSTALRTSRAPFIWSQSFWKWQKLRDVPDRVDGIFTLMPLYLR